MSADEPPPSYEEVDQDARLRIRLEIWHFCKTGRSSIYNHRLFRYFNETNLEKWTVTEAEVVQPDDPSCRDDFVPISVRCFQFTQNITRSFLGHSPRAETLTSIFPRLTLNINMTVAETQAAHAWRMFETFSTRLLPP